MITRIAIETTDEQRSHLAALLDGKPTKRLATRKEVGELVETFFAAFMGNSDKDEAPVGNSAAPQLLLNHPRAEALRREGKSDDFIASYMRGWHQVSNK